MSSLPFYAFRTPPQKEKAAHVLLTNRGFTSFFPHEVREVQRQRNRRHYRTEKTVPFLHGYALARHDGSPDWWPRIFRLNLILSVVGIAGQPYAIPEASLERLASMSGSRHALPRPKPLSVGGKARVTAGPFSGFAGRVEAVTNGRVKMLLGMFGAEREVEIEADKLEAA